MLPRRSGEAGRRSRRRGPQRGRAGGGAWEIRGSDADGQRRAAGILGAEGLGASRKRNGEPQPAVEFLGVRCCDVPLCGADEGLAQVPERVIKVCHCLGEGSLHRFGRIAAESAAEHGKSAAAMRAGSAALRAFLARRALGASRKRNGKPQPVIEFFGVRCCDIPLCRAGKRLAQAPDRRPVTVADVAVHRPSPTATDSGAWVSALSSVFPPA